MQWSYAEMCVELINLARLVTYRFKAQTAQKDDDFSMLKFTKKPIFPNAKPMDKDEEEQLIRRAIVYSFSCGLLRMKFVEASSHTLIFGILGVIFLLTIIFQELIHDIWAMDAFMSLTVIYLSIFIALTCVITGARDPEKVLKN